MNTIRRALSRGLALSFVGLFCGGSVCNPVSAFFCSTDDDCLGFGAGGVCEANSLCTFPDPGCTSGKRWHERAASLGGMCFEGEAGTGSSGGGTSGSSTSAPGSSSSGGLPVGDSSTGDQNPPQTSSSGGGETSLSGTTSTAPTMTCDAQYGAAADYLVCTETETSCSFNATLGGVLSCDEICAQFGGLCVSVDLNAADLCTPTKPGMCDGVGANDVICTCDRQ